MAFSLIGDAIERRSEITYRAFVEEKIFSPLGMQDAWLGERHHPAANWFPLVRTKAGWRAARPNNQYYKVLPAAGVNASIADMKRWLEALLGLTPLLSPSCSSRLDVSESTIRRTRAIIRAQRRSQRLAMPWDLGRLLIAKCLGFCIMGVI